MNQGEEYPALRDELFSSACLKSRGAPVFSMVHIHVAGNFTAKQRNKKSPQNKSFILP
jgi:hypothetical protein